MEIAYRRTMQVQAYESVSLEVKLNENECAGKNETELTAKLMERVDRTLEGHVKSLQHKDEAMLPDF